MKEIMKGKFLKNLFIIILILLGSVTVNANPMVLKNDNSGISVVVIDAGHGGKDPGAQVAGVKEKNVVLKIALKLGASIEAAYPGVKVIYTRKTDVFIPLHKRAEIANKNKADLFISIHANAVDGKSAYGTETFVLGLHRNADNLEVAKRENSVILLEDDYNTTYEGFDPNLPESYIMFETMQEEYQEQSVMLASSIQDEFREYAKRYDRSVKMAGFLVLRQTSMPSVLVETGFLSNTKERSYLNSNNGQAQLARSIFKAFVSYKEKIEDNSNFYIAAENDGVGEKITPAVTPVVKNTVTEKTTADAASEVPEPENVSNVPHGINPLYAVSDKKSKPVENETVMGKSIKSSVVAATNTHVAANRQPVVNSRNVYFSVQIMALKRRLEPVPANFKGEKDIFRQKGNAVYRYFSGKYDSFDDAENERMRIHYKYPNAFVVAFENGRLVSAQRLKSLK